MKELLNKELIFLRKNIKRFIFLFAIISIVNGFIFLKEKLGILDLMYILSITSSSFIISILFDSIMIEKESKSFEKIMQINSLKEIINSKAIISCIIATLVSFLFASILILIRGYNISDLYIMLLVPFLNLIFSKIFCLLLVLTEQMIVIQIMTIGFVLGDVIIFTSIKSFVLFIAISLISISMFYLSDIFINKIEVEKVI